MRTNLTKEETRIKNRMIDELGKLKARPNMFIQPVAPDVLMSFLHGLRRGALLSCKNLTFDDLGSSYRDARRSAGWTDSARAVYHEMYEKKVPEKNIIQKLIDLELIAWQAFVGRSENYE